MSVNLPNWPGPLGNHSEQEQESFSNPYTDLNFPKEGIKRDPIQINDDLPREYSDKNFQDK